MTVFESFLLSLLQGATEFLPVSSSGHLVLAENLLVEEMGGANNLIFVILAHAGTLLAIMFVFRRQVYGLVRYACVDGWRSVRSEGWGAAWLTDPKGRLVVAVLVATVPTGLIGLLGRDFLESLFEKPETVGWALCATALLLASTYGRGAGKEAPGGDLAPKAAERPFPLGAALAIGVIQGLAITPGISRSGATIALAILLGLDRQRAGEFSFLIAIPAICGALLVESLDFRLGAAGNLSLAAGSVALVVSALSGYVFLRLLLRFVRGGEFAYFSLYCLAVGIWAIWRF